MQRIVFDRKKEISKEITYSMTKQAIKMQKFQILIKMMMKNEQK